MELNLFYGKTLQTPSVDLILSKTYLFLRQNEHTWT